MTLAELKRKLVFGTMLECTFGPKIGLKRQVVEVQTNCIGLIEPNNPTVRRPSRLDIPKASLIEIDDDGFRIFEPELRPMTADEKKVWDNQPRDEKQEEADLISDGSTMFWRRKRYFEDGPFPYLFTQTNGKRLDRKTMMIVDPAVKGKLSLEYKFIPKETICQQ